MQPESVYMSMQSSPDVLAGPPGLYLSHHCACIFTLLPGCATWLIAQCCSLHSESLHPVSLHSVSLQSVSLRSVLSHTTLWLTVALPFQAIQMNTVPRKHSTHPPCSVYCYCQSMCSDMKSSLMTLHAEAFCRHSVHQLCRPHGWMDRPS